MEELRNNLLKHLSEAPQGSDAEHAWIIDGLAQLIRVNLKMMEGKPSTSAAVANITPEEVAKVQAILPTDTFEAIVTKGVNDRMKDETKLNKKNTNLAALLANVDAEIAAHIKRVKKALGITDAMTAQLKAIRA